MEKVVKLGDEYEVDFVRNKKGGRPIARIEGKVCLIHKDVPDFIAVGSRWAVSVVRVEERFLIIEPLLQIAKAKENEDEINRRIQAAFGESNTSNQKRNRISGPKTYPYKSKQQMRKD